MNAMNNGELGKRLRAARKKKGLTQEELAQQAGVSQQYISNVERGVVRSARELVHLARALGVSSDYLAGVQTDKFAEEIYDLILSLPPDRRQKVLAALRLLAQ